MVHIAPTAKQTNHALFRFKTLLLVERPPCAFLFILSEADVIVVEVIPQRTHIGLSPYRAPAEVNRHQGPCSSNSSIGMVKRPKRPYFRIH